MLRAIQGAHPSLIRNQSVSVSVDQLQFLLMCQATAVLPRRGIGLDPVKCTCVPRRASANASKPVHWICTPVVAALSVSNVSSAFASLDAWIGAPAPSSVIWYSVDGIRPVTTCVHGQALGML